MGSGQHVGLKAIWAQQGALVPGQMEGLLGNTQLLGAKREFRERRPVSQGVP